jgi:hypothetical protein
VSLSREGQGGQGELRGQGLSVSLGVSELRGRDCQGYGG